MFNFLVLSNYFLKDGVLPNEQKQSIYFLKKAIKRAISKNIFVKSIVSVSNNDLNFFKTYFKDDVEFLIFPLNERSSKRKLPFLVDIFNNAIPYLEDVTNQINKFNSQYCIYTNSDINVVEYIFEFIYDQLRLDLKNIEESHRGQNNIDTFKSFVINRKDVLHGENLPNLDNICDKSLRMHPGYDFFVFNSKILKSFELDLVAIGNPPVGYLLLINLLYHSKIVELIDSYLLTWHIGDGRKSNWHNHRDSPEAKRNQVAAQKAIFKLENRKLSKSPIFKK